MEARRAGPPDPLRLDGRSLTEADFHSVARHGRRVELAPGARPALERGRAAVERVVAAGTPVYGVTTGFGALSDRSIPPESVRELQRSLVESHASGVGPPLPREVVRGLVLLRANSLVLGLSGVRPEVVERLLEYLNRDLVPWVPETGSVGASGDLAPLAHLARTLLGEGAFVDPSGRPLPAGELLPKAGLPPIPLVAKEGLALINGTALMTSYLAFALDDLERLLRAALVASALVYDALRGSPDPLADRWGELRRSPEERAVAESMRRLLADSQLVTERSEWTGQDPYTLRCIPQVLGSVRHALRFGREILQGELNAVTDNPVLFDDGGFHSGGNFHGQSLALALDTLAIAAQTVAGFSERRVSRLAHPALNRGLPAFLAPDPGLSSGFMIPQTVAAALVNEGSTLVHPASAASLPTSADQEDFVSMGAWAGAKLRRMLVNSRRVVAIEWIMAGQALELRRPALGGSGSEAALEALRRRVAPWVRDRSPADDIAHVADAIADGSLVEEVERRVPFWVPIGRPAPRD
ncbi:MAG: histidine ammonia-lyase [Thermoplasmata archaeon]